jgi:hypothetical protein
MINDRSESTFRNKIPDTLEAGRAFSRMKTFISDRGYELHSWGPHRELEEVTKEAVGNRGPLPLFAYDIPHGLLRRASSRKSISAPEQF